MVNVVRKLVRFGWNAAAVLGIAVASWAGWTYLSDPRRQARRDQRLAYDLYERQPYSSSSNS
jgi:hypothetical protein